MPAKHPGAYFYDQDISIYGKHITSAFLEAREELLRGRDVAYPFRGVGTGLAQLENTAPRLMGLVHDGENMLKEAASMQIRADNLLQVRARLDHDGTEG